MEVPETPEYYNQDCSVGAPPTHTNYLHVGKPAKTLRTLGVRRFICALKVREADNYGTLRTNFF